MTALHLVQGVACLLVLGAGGAHALDLEGGARPLSPSRAAGPAARSAVQRPQPGVVSGMQQQASKWVQRYQGFVSGAAKVSKWINMGCGVCLLLQVPVTAIGSALTLNVPDLLLCVYLGGFGVILAGLEIPVGPLKRLFEVYFRFLYTTHGRLGFILLVAALTWSIRQVGIISKVFVAFNALLSFYVSNSFALRGSSEEDSLARASVDEAAQELQRGASDVLNLANVFGIGRMFRSSAQPSKPSPRQPPPGYGGYPQAPQPSPPGSPYVAAGRAADASSQPVWPSEDS